jgi:hypothetical protein
LSFRAIAIATTKRASMRSGSKNARDRVADDRVRLATSRLVEAHDSPNAYSQESDVNELVGRVPADAKKRLSKARSVLQKVGPKALDQVRNNTFHFPSPKTNYSPSSDEQLRNVLADRAIGPVSCISTIETSVRSSHSFSRETSRLRWPWGSSRQTTPSHATDFEILSEGAVAYKHWVDALVVTFLDATGSHLGTPRLIEDQPSEAPRGESESADGETDREQ